MKFRFIISKRANFYFFISNLSKWHFSCVKDYNILWQEELGQFSPEEKRALKIFKKIRCKYPSGKSLFERAFFTNKTPFSILKKNLPVGEYEIIAEVFKILGKKFNLLYKKELPFLSMWKNKLDNIKIDKVSTNSIIEILKTLFNTLPTVKKCNVYLLFSSEFHTSGGANIDEESVSLEISRYHLKNVNHVTAIIWHEIIHLLFQNNYFYPKLMEIFKDRQKTKIINEIIIASLFPRGVLGDKFFKNRIADKLYSGISLSKTKKILDLTEHVISDKKSFDEEYIRKIAKILHYKIYEN